jgi:uncharacterized coiled-coil protein SlyX
MKPTLTKALFALPLAAAVSGPLWADASLEQRVQQLEKQNKEYAKTIKALDKDVKRARRSTSNLMQTVNSMNERFQVHGFMSVGVSTLDEEGVVWGSTGVDSETNWNSDSVLGLQMNFKVDEKLEVVTQFVSKGGRNSELDTDWFYLGYRFNDNMSLQIGRLRPSYYAMSDFIEVGFAYPWVRPPIEVYDTIPTDVVQGLSFSYRNNFGEYDVFANLFLSQNVDEGAISDFDAQINGFYVELSRGPLTVGMRGGAAFADIVITSATAQLLQPILDGVVTRTGNPEFNILQAENTHIPFYAGGFRFDNGTWLVVGEGAAIQYEGIFSDIDAHYLTVGRRFGKFMPHFTYAHAYSTDDNVRAALRKEIGDGLGNLVDGVFTVQNKSYHLGLNYSLTSRATAKFEAQLITDFDNSIGQFDIADTARRTKFVNDDPDVWVYTFLIDTVF